MKNFTIIIPKIGHQRMECSQDQARWRARKIISALGCGMVIVRRQK